MAKYKYHAKCSQCGRGFRANTRSELLRKLRKHLWLKHEAWMRRRIKSGLKKSKKSSKNPAWLTSILTGIFPPANIPTIVSAYRDMSPKERTAVRVLLSGLTTPLGGEVSALASLILKGLDITLET